MTPPPLETAAVALTWAATEIFPVSGGGHAALLGLLFGVELGRAGTLALRAGAWLAIVVFFWDGVRSMPRDGLRGLLNASHERGAHGWRNARTVVLATFPMLAVSVGVREHVASWGKEPTLVGASLLVSAIAVGSTFWAPDGDGDAPSPWGALVVGAVLGAAMLPGLSRTGVALAALLWLGVRAERAFELTFLMAIPTDAVMLFWGTGRPDSLSATLVLTVMVTAVALVALRVLRAALRRRLLPLFSVYLVPLVIATLTWGYARP
jgi:undecaprenyl-diphosphatase